jgi:hypothetical protein
MGVLIRIALGSPTDKQPFVSAERLDEVVILTGRTKGERTPFPVLKMVDAVVVRMASLELGEAGSAWGRPSIVWQGVQGQNDGIEAWADRYLSDPARPLPGRKHELP